MVTYLAARRKLNDAVRAARQASGADKDRAREAMAKLGKSSDPDRAFVYDAFLSLLARGVRPTESNILEESKALFRANETFHEQRRQGRAAERVA